MFQSIFLVSLMILNCPSQIGKAVSTQFDDLMQQLNRQKSFLILIEVVDETRSLQNC